MRPRPPRRLTIAAIVLSLLAAACSGGADRRDDTPTRPATPSPAVALAPQDIEAAGATALRDLGAADRLAMAGGSAWVSGLGDGRDQVGRLHRQTGQVQATVTVPAPVCMGMDVGYGSLWAASCAPATITRINPKTAKVQARIPIDTASLAPESSLAAAEGAVWALTLDEPPQLIKIDPQTNAVSDTVPAPEGATAIRAGLGGLWLTGATTGTLHRLDPDDLSVVATLQVGQGANLLAVGEDAVWVLSAVDGTVVRVDPATNTAAATIKVADEPVNGGDIAVGGGSVWARVTDQLAVRIDPATNTVTARYGPPGGSGGVAADTAAVWLSAHDSQTVWRLPLS